MKNLGDKLQEARNAMGLSVRDAADATRLRADVIENMEAGKFDFKLQEIYKRGLLRIYATFLKLDVDAILAEYTAFSKANGDAKKARHILSRMASAQHSEQQQEIPVGAPTPESLEARFEEAATQDEESKLNSENEDDPMRYLKLGAIFVALVLAVVVIILIVSSAVRSDPPEENPDLDINAQISTQPADATAQQQPQPTAAAGGEIILTITATGDTYLLAYPENAPAAPLFSGPIQAGERKEFKSQVPIMVKLTDAERIKMERNAKPLDLKGAKGLRLFKIGYAK